MPERTAPEITRDRRDDDDQQKPPSPDSEPMETPLERLIITDSKFAVDRFGSAQHVLIRYRRSMAAGAFGFGGPITIPRSAASVVDVHVEGHGLQSDLPVGVARDRMRLSGRCLRLDERM
jgi:hypothetical protein